MTAIARSFTIRFRSPGRFSVVIGAMLLCVHLTPALASRHLTLCTDWFAEAEHGGYYQAIAQGIYQQQGLDVTVKMGGPQINGIQMLLGGVCDFIIASPLQVLKDSQKGIPIVAVASSFQKDPQAIIAHEGVASLQALKGKPIYIAASSKLTWWPWLKQKFGFSDSQIRPYNFSIAPFLHDPNSAVQGYISSAPPMVERAGQVPVTFLLSDYGWPAYAGVIVTTRSIAAKEPGVVKAFIQATMEGWKSYLIDPRPANKLIQQANPKQTDLQLAYSLNVLKLRGFVTGGAAAVDGIGTMSAKRWQAMYEFMLDNHLIPKKFDYLKAYDLNFINQIHVMPIKSQ
jgi:NitT/TauT family transport system substrate-binding protein